MVWEAEETMVWEAEETMVQEAREIMEWALENMARTMARTLARRMHRDKTMAGDPRTNSPSAGRNQSMEVHVQRAIYKYMLEDAAQESAKKLRDWIRKGCMKPVTDDRIAKLP